MRNDRDQDSELEPVPDGSLDGLDDGWEGQETIESKGWSKIKMFVIESRKRKVEKWESTFLWEGGDQ